MLVIGHQEPVTRGGERAVFEHPAEAGLLLKVLVADGDTSRGGPARAFFSRYLKGYRLRLLRREYEEYLRLTLANVDRTNPLPVAHMFGFAATDKGMACLTESVRMPDGSLGRTWRSLCETGVSPQDATALGRLGRSLISLGVRCSDLTAGNVVLGHRTFGDRLGPYEAVLVDGFGDTHAVPIRTWSRAANRLSIHKRMGRLGRGAGLVWDRDALTFSPT